VGPVSKAPQLLSEGKMPPQAADPAPAVRRIHSLDGLRSGLMLLGVVLHSAYPYSDGARWLVRDPQRNSFFQALTQGIHLFRMPAFFLVAGYFAALLLRQSKPADFLRERLRRIGVPLLSTLFTLNLLQTWLLQKRSTAHSWLPSGDEVQLMWSSGSIVGHLWFLVYLLVFCALVAAGATSIKRFTLSRWPAWLATHAGFAAMLGLAMACSLGVVVLDHLAPALLNHEYLGLIDPSELLTYVPFFCVGLLLETNEALLLRFSSPGAYTPLAGLVAFAVMAASPVSRVLRARVCTCWPRRCWSGWSSACCSLLSVASPAKPPPGSAICPMPVIRSTCCIT